MSLINTEPEYIYLRNMHDSTLQNEVDLHTYFWLKTYEVCPICNQWLIMRAKPTQESKRNEET